MKFLADVGISPRSVEHLRQLGYDAVHLIEQGLQRLPDSDILAKAYSEERVLLTHDLDFADLMAASRATLPSVVIFRLRNMRPEHVNHYLDQILHRYEMELQQGAIISVMEAQVRLRNLPL
jgi:predicted nuclease of predicted toxin-antitoxin system